MKSYSLEQLAKHFEATQSDVHRYVTEVDYNKLAAKLEKLISSVNNVLDGKADLTDLAEVCAMKPEQCLVERDGAVAKASFIDGYQEGWNACALDEGYSGIQVSEQYVNQLLKKASGGE